MKIKTNVKVGRVTANHHQSVAQGLKVRSCVKAGRITANHHQTVAQIEKAKGSRAIPNSNTMNN